MGRRVVSHSIFHPDSNWPFIIDSLPFRVVHTGIAHTHTHTHTHMKLTRLEIENETKELGTRREKKIGDATAATAVILRTLERHTWKSCRLKLGGRKRNGFRSLETMTMCRHAIWCRGAMHHTLSHVRFPFPFLGLLCYLVLLIDWFDFPPPSLGGLGRGSRLIFFLMSYCDLIQISINRRVCNSCHLNRGGLNGRLPGAPLGCFGDAWGILWLVPTMHPLYLFGETASCIE